MGLGKNDQKLYVIPSQNMVIIRMGNPPTGSEPMQIVYDRQMWELISALPCATSVTETNDVDMPVTWPNPVVDVLHHRGTSVVVRTIDGRVVRSETAPSVDISNLPSGVYTVESSTATTTSRSLIVKQ